MRVLVHPGSCAPAVVSRRVVAPRPRAHGWRVTEGLGLCCSTALLPKRYDTYYTVCRVRYLAGASAFRTRPPACELVVLRAALDGVVRGMGTIFIFAFFRHNSRLKSTRVGRSPEFLLSPELNYSAETPLVPLVPRRGRSRFCGGVNPGFCRSQCCYQNKRAGRSAGRNVPPRIGTRGCRRRGGGRRRAGGPLRQPDLRDR